MRRPVPKSQRQYVKNSPARRAMAKLEGVKPGKFPAFIPPMLATLRATPQSDPSWVHEIKFDGYRLQVHLQEGQAGFFTRRGYDWTPRFKSLQEPFWNLNATSAVIDGEVVVLTDEGLSDFGALEDDLGAGRSDRLVYFAFDLLYLDGFDLRRAHLIDRKNLLSILLEGSDDRLRYSAHVEGGQSLLADACRMHLEGLVSKRRSSVYSSRRSADWVKATCRKRDTFIVAGIAYKRGKFEGVYLGRKNGRSLTYAGKVERGFTPESQQALERRAASLSAKAQPLTPKIRKPKAHWLKPKLKVDVEYRALTGEGKVRHPSFRGLREDI